MLASVYSKDGGTMANEELLKRYKKERTRIKRLSTYYQHKGYQFNLEDILPPVPKRITEGSVRRLQKITSQRIKNKAIISITPNNEETALAIVQPEEKQEENEKPKRPRKQREPKSKSARDEFYEKSDMKKGTDMIPYEAPEVILNTAESFDGTGQYSSEDWQNVFSYDVTPSEKPTVDRMLYDMEELHSDLLEIQGKLNSWQVDTRWSETLQRIKARETVTAKEIIKEAVESLGEEETARIIFEHKNEITEMINEIMYRGSGTDFIKGRDAVHNDLVRLAGIFSGRSLSLTEVSMLSDRMESQEYNDLVDEMLE